MEYMKKPPKINKTVLRFFVKKEVLEWEKSCSNIKKPLTEYTQILLNKLKSNVTPEIIKREITLHFLIHFLISQSIKLI